MPDNWDTRGKMPHCGVVDHAFTLRCFQFIGPATCSRPGVSSGKLSIVEPPLVRGQVIRSSIFAIYGHVASSVVPGEN